MQPKSREMPYLVLDIFKTIQYNYTFIHVHYTFHLKNVILPINIIIITDTTVQPQSKSVFPLFGKNSGLIASTYNLQ